MEIPSLEVGNPVKTFLTGDERGSPPLGPPSANFLWGHRPALARYFPQGIPTHSTPHRKGLSPSGTPTRCNFPNFATIVISSLNSAIHFAGCAPTLLPNQAINLRQTRMSYSPDHNGEVLRNNMAESRYRVKVASQPLWEGDETFYHPQSIALTLFRL